MKLVVSSGNKSLQTTLDPAKTQVVVGRKIGETVQGDAVGLPGYTLTITGGSDKDGTPMRPDMGGIGRKKLVLSDPPGFHPRLCGMRKRKYVCGNVVSESIVQLNTKVTVAGGTPLDQLIKVEKKEEKAEEKK